MARREFCTLFDVNFAPRGLVLYESLAEVCPSFRLRVLCMDDATHDLLDRLSLPNLELIPIRELENHDPGLAATKPTRSPVEYCWTSTAALCLSVLERESDVGEITYLDADLMFFADPEPLFDELGDRSIALVPHRFAPGSETAEEFVGRFNVEWLTFRRDENGLAALQYWRERCLEWCYHRFEDGKFGDQKYLDDWPERFGGVQVLQHLGAGVGHWNVRSHALAVRDGRPVVDGQPLVFFHFSALRLFERRVTTRWLPLLNPRFRYQAGPVPFLWTAGPLREIDRRLIWEPYIDRLSRALDRIRVVEPGFAAGLRTVTFGDLARQAATVAVDASRSLVARDGRPRRPRHHREASPDQS